MAGTAVSPAPLTGMDTTGERKDDVTPSKVNAFRIAAVIDRLALQFCNASRFDSVEFFNLCLSLARGIDFAVSNQEIPARAQELPLLLKQVCQSRNDGLLLAATMVLMISVKNACQNGWFSDRDSKELCSLADQIGSCFCSSMDFNTEPSSSQATVSTIMTRFYPRMKMGQILLFLEVKPGYGAYVKDFQISKQMRHSPSEKARLLVAQTDNTETSSCLISPQDVSFLLNGKGVERRTNVFVDTGPQMPTVVTHILKYGSNLLQAVGEFNGNYVIVVALMSESTMENLVLQDHVQPAATVVDPDSEIIEGPSRISLNCPISFRRIRTPVKGHSCKHLQCFDFDNYMDINSKRPFWRCPHCNHHVCFTDIRIDQNMVKVLEDVGENVNDVIISSNGSWKAIMESDDHAEKQQDKFPVMEEDGPEEPGSAMFSNAPPDVLDLTQVDDQMDVALTCEAEERKLLPNNSQAQSSAGNMTSNPCLTINDVDQNISTQIEDNFWTGIYLSTFGSASPMLDVQNGGIPESSPTDALVSPDANSPAPNCEVGVFHGNSLHVATSGPQSETSPQSALQLQPFQFGNSSNCNEYGRSPSAARHVSRTPMAVQALPAQAPTTVPQRPRNSTSNMIQGDPSPTSAGPFSRNMERQQQFSRSHDSLQVSQTALSSLQQNMYPQQERQFLSVSAQQITGLQASNQLRVSYPSTISSRFQNSSPQQPLNLRMPHTFNQSPGISGPQTSNLRMPHSVNQSAGMFQPSAQLPRTILHSQGHQGGSQGVSSQAVGGVNGQCPRTVAAQRAAQVTRGFQTSRVPSLSGNAEGIRTSPVGDLRRSTGSMTQSVARSDASGNSPADQDWRPSGRMRGSLSGRAYDALIQHIIQPTQQAQPIRAPSNANSIPPNASSQLQILLANRAALQATNYSSTGLSSMSGGSGVLPMRSSEMN